jgi:L-fuconolactonase
MPALDAQLHPYGRNHPGRPWVGTCYGLAEVPGDRMAAATATARYWFHRSARYDASYALARPTLTGSGW